MYKKKKFFGIIGWVGISLILCGMEKKVEEVRKEIENLEEANIKVEFVEVRKIKTIPAKIKLEEFQWMGFSENGKFFLLVKPITPYRVHYDFYEVKEDKYNYKKLWEIEISTWWDLYLFNHGGIVITKDTPYGRGGSEGLLFYDKNGRLKKEVKKRYLSTDDSTLGISCLNEVVIPCPKGIICYSSDGEEKWRVRFKSPRQSVVKISFSFSGKLAFVERVYPRGLDLYEMGEGKLVNSFEYDDDRINFRGASLNDEFFLLEQFNYDLEQRKWFLYCQKTKEVKWSCQGNILEENIRVMDFDFRTKTRPLLIANNGKYVFLLGKEVKEEVGVKSNRYYKFQIYLFMLDEKGKKIFKYALGEREGKSILYVNYIELYQNKDLIVVRDEKLGKEYIFKMRKK